MVDSETKLNFIDNKLALSVKEAAELTGIGLGTMYQLIHAKGFPAIKLGKKVIIVKSKLEEWLINNIGQQIN